MNNHPGYSRGPWRKIIFFIYCFCPVTAWVFLLSACPVRAEIRLETIKLPKGFLIELYAGKVEGARSLTLGPKGVVFVGSHRPGKVYALLDRNADQRVEEVITLAEGLESPNGVAFRQGSLYVAEISRILRFEDIVNRLHNPPKPVVVNDTFPRDRHHGWKFIAFWPGEGRWISWLCPTAPSWSPTTRPVPFIASAIKNPVNFSMGVL
ncbi:MAG: hypothetical protein HY787_19400 [Deltaproteobacteria bacterium]|nr:hypothetical protein [Deltaproteobacteria bacterium]